MTRWKGAAVLAVITAVLLYAIQLMPSEPVPSTPVMGIVSTAAEDDRREAQVRALVQAAEADGFEVLSMPVERTQEAQIEAIRALCLSGRCDCLLPRWWKAVGRMSCAKPMQQVCP